MAMREATTCKTKNCSNPPLKGKYCLRCAKQRKENRDGAVKAIAAVGGVIVLSAFAVVKNGAKAAPTVVQAALRFIK